MYDFSWRNPILINDFAWSEQGTLIFSGCGIAKTAIPPIWAQEASNANSFNVSLRVRTFSSAQVGPARIFSVSLDPFKRNLTIAQDNEDLVVRLRSHTSDLNGLPEIRVDSVFESENWQEIELVVEQDSLIVFVNQQIRFLKPFQNSSLDLFDTSFLLALGNELTGNRGWQGEISQAQVRVDTVTFDYLTTDALDTPRFLRWYFRKPEFNPFKSSSFPDMLQNFLGFIPLGIIAVTLLNKEGRRPTIVLAYGFFTSLTIECSQWLLPDRYPSTNDLMLNTMGTVAGIVIAVIYRRV